ncbi:NEB [Vulpes lagopus]
MQKSTGTEDTSERGYRMDGDVAKTVCHVDEKAKDIEHAKKVSQQVTKVLYKQNWEDTKDEYLHPPDAPELVQAVKNTAMCGKKLYTEDWEADKSLFYAYNNSPLPRRVAQAQKALSDVKYKKDSEKSKGKPDYNVLSASENPLFKQLKAAGNALSDVITEPFKENYEKTKAKIINYCETPKFQLDTVLHNFTSDIEDVYKQDWEKSKARKFDLKVDAISLLAAKANSRIARDVMYKKDYDKSKGEMIGALSINDDPKMLHFLKRAKNQSDYYRGESYEKTKAKSMNYCETPKYQLDTLLKNFSETKYKDSYVQNVLGHYVGSFEDPYQIHCMKVSVPNCDIKLKTMFLNDILWGHTCKVHPDKTKFMVVTDTPVLLQAQLNVEQLSDLNYKAKRESEKFKCNVPADAPQFIQHRVNSYNLSDKSKAKQFDMKVDAIPLLAAKANSRITRDVMYKKDYDKSKGKMIGALNINDDPKMLHSLKRAKNQSDHEYRKDYEKSKTIYRTPLDMLQVTRAKKSQEIASDMDYKHILHNCSYPPNSINVDLAKEAYALQSDVEFKADYNSWIKGCGWVPFGSLEMEKAKRASDTLNEKKYRQHPDALKFTSIEDAPIIVQSKINLAQRSDVAYKAKGEEILHKYNLPADLPQFIQAKVNAYSISEICTKTGLKDLSKQGYDLRMDAIPIRAAKAARQAASEVRYKKDYENAKGKMVGFLSLQDDPKLEKTKTKYNTPHDVFNVVVARKARDVASNVNYKHTLHHYTYLPDAMDLELSKNMMHIQSNNACKEDYNTWMKRIGWIPIGSLDVEKVKKAGDALNEKKYRQHPDTLKFTSTVDSPIMVQTKQNTKQVSDYKYKEAYEKSEGKHVGFRSLQDDPTLVHYMNVAKLYLGDMLIIMASKSSQDVVSNVNYKQLIHHYTYLPDAMSLEHTRNVNQIQSDKLYQNAWNKDKTNITIPSDMPGMLQAPINALQISNKLYSFTNETKQKDYDFKADAIEIKQAKASRDTVIERTCEEDDTEPARSTSRKKRFKKVRFSPHNRVKPISVTEGDRSCAWSTPRKKRFKKVRFALHNRVKLISATEEDPTEGPAEDVPMDEAQERASSLPEVDAETNQNSPVEYLTQEIPNSEAEEETSALSQDEGDQDGFFIRHFSRRNVTDAQDLCLESIDGSSSGEEDSAVEDDSMDTGDSRERGNIVPLSRSIPSTDLREAAREEICTSEEKDELETGE